MEGAVYLCQPGYGQPDPSSARQFWARSSDPAGPYRDVQRVMDDKGGSLLANGFNRHWCNALNLQRAGLPLTRFAMLHSDVIPQDWWLDQLLADMDETGADLMAAVPAIKDARGISSTAIEDPADDWEVYRRLTMKEVHRLPEVFSADDCGYADRLLLANTGCWVCDFTKPWRFAVHFEIRDRIVFRTEDGRLLPPCGVPDGLEGGFIAQVYPEDWGFSRQVGRLGGKVLCTRRVSVNHMGVLPYGNAFGWGEYECDEDTRVKHGGRPIGAGSNGNGKPHTVTRPLSESELDVEGWLTDAEGRALARLAAGKLVLEVGSWKGRSTIWMARTARHVTAVDTFDGRGTVDTPVNTYEELLANLRRHQVKDRVTVWNGASEKLLAQFRETLKFDLVFIDASHDYDSVRADVDGALPLLREGGLLVFHDYHSADDPDVTRAVDELLAGGAELLETVDTLAVVRPCAAGVAVCP